MTRLAKPHAVTLHTPQLRILLELLYVVNLLREMPTIQTCWMPLEEPYPEALPDRIVSTLPRRSAPLIESLCIQLSRTFSLMSLAVTTHNQLATPRPCAWPLDSPRHFYFTSAGSYTAPAPVCPVYANRRGATNRSTCTCTHAGTPCALTSRITLSNGNSLSNLSQSNTV